MLGDSYHENYPYVTYGDNYTDRYPLTSPFDVSNVPIDLPEWAIDQSSDAVSLLDTTPPTVLILSPENMTFPNGNLSLTFIVNEPTLWMGYSLDGLETVTIAGNTTIS
jgi:hypothetical protein